MTTNHWLSVIVFAPLVGAVINWLIGRRVRNEAFIGTIACGSIGISTVIAFIIAFGLLGTPGALASNEPVMSHLWRWMEVGRFRADFGFAMDRLSGIYALFITFVGLLIHVFATGYMHGDKGYYRFFAYLNLFMFMMLVLVLADNILLMFVGWEGVGLCSYLLIGYYVDRREAGDAAKKAFIVNRIGDWGVVLGIMLLFFLTGSISFFNKPETEGVSAVRSFIDVVRTMPVEPFTAGAIIVGGLTSVAVLLFIGATGKSAQIPLFVWLPDAMAGPTPVSALIHAATMVTAGVYLIVRCSEIYVRAPTAMIIIAVIGLATALIAATIGLAQNDIKKVLAYSTVSQIGFMMLACGVGAFVAAIFHVMTHAFFKALLFLGSGSVIHGMHHEQDMRRMGGLKKYMPVTFLTMCAGWLAICGIPIFAGFWSKDEILYKTFTTEANTVGTILWFVGLCTAVITAIYMTRMMVMTFWGTDRFAEVPAGGQGDEAHAQAYADNKTASHDAHTPTVDDRPHHAAGEHVSATAHHVSHHDDEDEAHQHHGLAPGQVPHESPLVMTLPLIILAVLSVFGGLIGAPYALSLGLIDNPFHHTLERSVAHEPNFVGGAAHGSDSAPDTHAAEEHSPAAPTSANEAAHGTGATAAHDPEEVRTERILAGVSIFGALLGIAIGWIRFQRYPLAVMPRLLENKYYVDEIYNGTIVNPIREGSRYGLWRFFDVGVIDGIVNGLGAGVREAGRNVRYLQFGFVRGYAAIILLGALFVVGYFAYYGFRAFVR